MTSFWPLADAFIAGTCFVLGIWLGGAIGRMIDFWHQGDDDA